MPAAKILSPSQEKAKRKRVDFDAETTSNNKTTIQKPKKKLRRDNPTANVESSKQKAKMKANSAGDVGLTEASDEEPSHKPSKKLNSTKKATRAEEALAKDGDVGMAKKKLPHPDAASLAPMVNLEQEEVEVQQAEEAEMHLQGFSSESDSSDEELDEKDTSPLDISELPSLEKGDAALQHKIQKARKHSTGEKGVIYLGRIPHGFHEDQMRAYFTQFGDVTRLRLSRNKKTGRSKHYGFIEFSSSAVAEIVSETMNNYLLLGHILQCRIIPKDQVHPELWVGANKKWRVIPRDRVARVKQNKPRTPEEQKRAELKLLARQKKRQAKILASGIQYDFQDVAYKQKAPEVN